MRTRKAKGSLGTLLAVALAFASGFHVLTNLASANPDGASVGYDYDPLNRLAAVNDTHLGRTTYGYDAIGNLHSFIYPNGLTRINQYDELNRHTNLASGRFTTAIANYAYTVGASGNRLTASETMIGSTLNAHPSTINRVYSYDNIYQLTGEAVTFNSQSSAVNYSYDPVGNRQTRTSTLDPLPSRTYGYDPNDRLTSDLYDPNGNTTIGSIFDPYTASSQRVTDTYDFENRLVFRNNP